MTESKKDWNGIVSYLSQTEKRPPIFLICGVPGSGKSWVCRQLSDKFKYVPHDRCWSHHTLKPGDGIDEKWPAGAISNHLETILEESSKNNKPLITEIPFGERKLRDDLEGRGLEVKPFFVIEAPHIVASRYQQREGKPIPKNVHTRATSIIDRAKEWNAPHGTSGEILNLLKNEGGK